MFAMRLKSDHKAAVSETKPAKITQQQQYSPARLALIAEQERQQMQQSPQL